MIVHIHYGDAELINELFAAGENLYTIGNDYYDNLDIISSYAYDDLGGTMVKKVTNSVTEKMWSSYTISTDTRYRVKFVSGTEVWYTETPDGGSITYDSIGCLKGSKGNKWIHSQWNQSVAYINEQRIVYYLLGK